MLALSTTWNAHRHTDGERLLREIQDQGFTAVALGSETPVSLVAGLKRVIQKGHVKAVAVEGYFPAPPGYAETSHAHCHLSAPARDDRRKAVQWTAQTLDYAADFGAEVLLLQPGSTALQGLTTALAGFIRNHPVYSRSYVRLKLQTAVRRAQASKRCMDRLHESLEELVPLARAKRVKLALPGQAHLEGIPNEDEMQSLLQAYQEADCLGYWHDFGAAQVKANLGFVQQLPWLEHIRPWLLGGYLHDAVWPDQPHRLPFSGQVPFPKLIPALPPEAPLVWKIPASVPASELSQAFLAWSSEFSRVT